MKKCFLVVAPLIQSGIVGILVDKASYGMAAFCFCAFLFTMGIVIKRLF